MPGLWAPSGQGDDALVAVDTTIALCLECVTLDSVHSLGVPGTSARREHVKRKARHETTVRTNHPILSGLKLIWNGDPQHVTAWKTGAAGEEAFGHKLSANAGDALKVLHDRKLPRSSANIL